MSRGRKKTRNGSLASKKQVKLITSRLMEISLKVERYIYKQKPISTENAKMYIEEVTSYKIQCKNDVRSLQVIEKLTHQMKSIITEQENVDHYANIYELIENSCTQEYNRSPVYSIGDDDVPPNFGNEGVVDLSTPPDLVAEEVEHINLCDNHDEHDINKNITVDLTETVNDMQKQISTLSLHTIESAVHNFDSVEFSQSILGDTLPFQGNTLIASKNIINEAYETQHVNKPQNSASKSINNKIIENFANNLNVNKVQDLPMHVANVHMSNTNAKNIKPLERQTKDNTNNIVNVKDNKQKKGKPKTSVDATKQKEKNATKKVVNKKTKSLVKVKQGTLKVNDKVLISPINNTFNSITKIYNSNVENDLSWIENLRFVREVTLDEFDPKLSYLDESFWHNCDLPENWDDRDFI